MITLTLTLATIDDALEAVTRLSGVTAGVSVSSGPVAADEAPAKKATPKQKAEVATKAAFDEDEAPAKGKKTKKAKPAISIEELKAEILKHAPQGAGQPAAVKEFVASFGVSRISDLTEAQRAEAFDAASTYFASDDEDEDEDEDPMA